MRIILASQSPRRKELLEMLNVKFDVIVSNCDESFKEGLTIEEQSKQIAYMKAKTVFDKTTGDRIVIGADSMVLKDGNIYGKPQNRQNAIKILSDLKNAKHQVITSLAVLIQDGENYKEYIDYDIADVYFKDMTEKEILDWIDTGKSLDKAGGYAVQSEFGVFIDRIDGNYYTVVGLPIHKLYDIIKQYI